MMSCYCKVGWGNSGHSSGLALFREERTTVTNTGHVYGVSMHQILSCMHTYFFWRQGDKATTRRIERSSYIELFCKVYTQLGDERLEVHAAGKEQSTDLMLHACCSQVDKVYIQQHELADKLFVVHVWSLVVEVARITLWPQLPCPIPYECRFT